MESKLKVTCPSCGHAHETTTYPGINVGESPELKARVKDGSLFIWECPHCGARNLARYQTIYHDPDQRLMIWLLPEGSLPEEQRKLLESRLSGISDTLDGYVLRRVGDVGSLIEKVNIFDAGLDDMVIEMSKYVTKMELAQKAEGKDIMDVPFKFFRMEGPDNDISFSYPKDGAMHGAQIGFNVYEDCAGILRRNPSIKPSGAFPVVDQDLIGRFFR